MSEHPFDQQIARKVESYRQPVSPTVWEGVQAGITTTGQGNRNWLLLSGLLVLLLLGAAAGIVLTGNGDQNTAQDMQFATAEVEEFSADRQQVTTGSIARDQTINAGDLAIDKSNGSVANTSAGGSGQKMNTGSGTVFSNTDTGDDQRGIGNVPAGGPDDGLSTSAIQTGFGVDQVLQQRVENYGNSYTLSTSGAGEKALTASSLMNTSRIRNQLLPILNTGFSNLHNAGMPSAISDAMLLKIRTDCYSFGENKAGRFYIDIYAGPVFPSYQLTSRNESVPGYITARDTTETTRLSWDAGVRLGYMLRSGFSVAGGLHYTEVNRLFDYVDPDAEEYDTVYTEIKIINGMDTTITIDTSYSLVSGTRTKKTYNKYRTLDIPLLIGYNFTTGGNWNFAVQAGPVFNLMFRQQGDFIAPTGDPANFDSDDSAKYPAYRTNLGISMYASIQMTRRIGTNTYFFVEPHLLYRFRDMTIESYPISEKHHNFGLSAGLRFTL